MLLALQVLIQTLNMIESQLRVVGGKIPVATNQDREYCNKFTACKVSLRATIRGLTELADAMGDNGYK